MIIRPSRSAVSAAAAGAAALVGIAAALYYARADLTLSHYDARGHLIVARRIFDSLTPGWRQIGAIWLPLPHLLNALPVQVDAWYRNGASAVAISVAAFAVASGALASLVFTLSGSRTSAVAAVAVFVLNPNLLYLQATPMTEPLLLACTLVASAWLARWLMAAGGRSDRRWALSVGSAFALGCLTRYEAWPVTASAIAVAVWTFWRRGDSLSLAARRVAPMAIVPAIAVAGFMVFSRIVVGAWFVSSGFFVPENRALGRPVLSAVEIFWGIQALSGWLVLVIGSAGVVGAFARGLLRRARGPDLLLLALVTADLVAWVAFSEGHPFRVRYMVPLIAAEAAGAGFLAGLLPAGRARWVGALLVVLAAAHDLRPVDARAPMVLEAQWDRPNSHARTRVTACLRDGYDGESILASMGSLGHYMQETAHAGFALRDFLHEGNGVLWPAALENPRAYVGWILIEEHAEGGDMLALRAREHPDFLDGFSRVCEGGGVALYRRQNRTLNTARYEMPPRSIVGAANPMSAGSVPFPD